ncbi:hypothetical protein AMTR_s00056p00097290 [Amborella trichopoda]|uniref:RING-type domain-containing protein n=1 Tax=Amborella trichopoda TaxID=13333 RepID=U5D160_AMBTC|nr:hypothetical protein AMTR_s00056p00097290 [Amborella trichopoda]
MVREVDDVVEVEAVSTLFLDRRIGSCYGMEHLERVAMERQAVRLAVESLKTVDMEDEEVVCTICIFEMDFGTVDAKAMPCWHKYHGEYIVAWLEYESSCRYQLPTAK